MIRRPAVIVGDEIFGKRGNATDGDVVEVQRRLLILHDE